jgi:Fe-S cluster biogenesis protein NfuA/nitrite reductase/ring-hydroxylating ferredoxin subunit
VGDSELVTRVEAALEDLEALPDPASRGVATAAVRAVLDLYGEGLARIAAFVERPEVLTGDDLVAHLLFVHGLHPEPVEARVARALDEVRPYLQSHGGGVELLEVRDGVARVELEGSCQGCPSSAMTLKLAVEEAIGRLAPDVDRIDAGEDAAPAAPDPAPALTLLQIEPMRPPGSADDGDRDGDGASRWTSVGALPELSDGGMVVREVDGAPAVLLGVGDDRYAYRAACPGCGAALGEGKLIRSTLRCTGCGLGFDVRHAGRCLDDAGLHLEPLPLLVGETGVVRLAVGA